MTELRNLVWLHDKDAQRWQLWTGYGIGERILEVTDELVRDSAIDVNRMVADWLHSKGYIADHVPNIALRDFS